MIIIMGMIGAGKTVQSQLIQNRLGFHWLSTGQILRDTEDKEILAVHDRGEFVDDEMVIRVVSQKLKAEGYDKDFLLDGFPRNLTQAKWLIEHSEEIDKHVRAVLFLDVDEEVSTERLASRGRGDDTREAIKKRREQQQEKAKPMIDYLKSCGIPFEHIDANRSVEEVFESIKEAVTKHYKNSESA